MTTDNPNPSDEQAPSGAGDPGKEAKPEIDCQDEVIMSWLSEPSPSASSDGGAQVYQAELVDEPAPRSGRLRKRRRLLPLSLFVLTCGSTFFAGACRWVPASYLFSTDWMPLRRELIVRWEEGLIYMLCVLAILLTHEMGHFVATILHRIPASFPYFLPLPITPLGTLGAVIGMDGLRANRRQMFDIGIAGPIAGLCVAVPILLIGVEQLEFSAQRYGQYKLDNPLLVQLLLWLDRPSGYVIGEPIMQGQLNPYFMAGWVGMLITGLNMLPVSQLDGGHVTYTLLGKKAHWVARGFMLLSIIWMLLSGNHAFILMVFLIMLVGTDHPPTSDDQISLGWFRTTLGWCSLAIPILCFAPRALMFD